MAKKKAIKKAAKRRAARDRAAALAAVELQVQDELRGPEMAWAQVEVSSLHRVRAMTQ